MASYVRLRIRHLKHYITLGESITDWHSWLVHIGITPISITKCLTSWTSPEVKPHWLRPWDETKSSRYKSPNNEPNLAPWKGSTADIRGRLSGWTEWKPGDSRLLISVQIYWPNQPNRKPTHRLSRRLHAAPPARLWISSLPSPWRTTCTFLTPTMCLFFPVGRRSERGRSGGIKTLFTSQANAFLRFVFGLSKLSTLSMRCKANTPSPSALARRIQYTYFAWMQRIVSMQINITAFVLNWRKGQVCMQIAPVRSSPSMLQVMMWLKTQSFPCGLHLGKHPCRKCRGLSF